MKTNGIKNCSENKQINVHQTAEKRKEKDREEKRNNICELYMNLAR